MTVVLDTATAATVDVVSGDQIRMFPTASSKLSDQILLLPGFTNAEVMIAGNNLSTTQTGKIVDVTGSNFSITSIVLGNSDRISTFTIHNPTGTDLPLDNFSAPGGLNSFIGDGVYMAGPFDASGLRSATFEAIGSTTFNAGGIFGSTTLRTGNVMNSTFNFDGGLKRWDSTTILSTTPGSTFITTPIIDAFNVRGDANLNFNVSGNFSSGLFTGAISGGSWTIGGRVDRFRAGTFGPSYSATIGNGLSLLQSDGLFSGSLQTPFLKTAKLGSVDSAQFTVTLPFRMGAFDTDTFSVSGTFSNSSFISDGSIGAFRAGSMLNSTVFSGINPAASVGVLPGISDIQSFSWVRSFAVTGRSATFQNSFIAGGYFGATDLGTVVPQASGAPFGITTTKLQSLRFDFGGRLIHANNVDRAQDLSTAEQRANVNPTDLVPFTITLANSF
jgi:hypothetical protein